MVMEAEATARPRGGAPCQSPGACDARRVTAAWVRLAHQQPVGVELAFKRNPLCRIFDAGLLHQAVGGALIEHAMSQVDYTKLRLLLDELADILSPQAAENPSI